MCVSAQAAAIQSAGRRKGSDGRTVLAKHCPSSDAFLTSPNRPGGVLERPIWGPRLRCRNRNISNFCSSPLLSRGLKRDTSPFDAQSPHFPRDFDTKLAKKPRACKKNLKIKKTALEDSKRGLMDGAYGNYALIYHLGHGD